MREMGGEIVVPYGEFNARRQRRLRVLAELRLQARAHTIDRRRDAARARHREAFMRSMRLVRRTET